MSSSSHHRHNARSSGRLTGPSRTRPPSSSHSNNRPSPGSSRTALAAPLWGPALWNNLLAAGREHRTTPTPQSKSGAARSVSPPRSRPPRSLRNKTPACLDEYSDSSSEEELREVIVTKTLTEERIASNRYREEDENMLSTANVQTPPVSKERAVVQLQPKAARPAIVPCKRSTPNIKEDHAERVCKKQRTNQMESPIFLDDSPLEPSTRSASQNFGLYLKSAVASDDNATQLAGLERELEICKQNCEARIKALKREHEETLKRLNQEHDTALKSTARDHETQIKSQLEAQRLETKILLDDIQRTATSQDDEKTQLITTLNLEIESLKGQLHAEKTAHLILIQSLDQREVLVPTEESIKALEAQNLALVRENETLKHHHRDSPPQSLSRSQDIYPPARPERPLSPTPTLSSCLHSSDETKTTNVRNMFLKVKRRHDNLVTVAKRIRDVTHGMDLSGFGDFGKHVSEMKRVLTAALEDDSGGGGGKQGGRGGVGER